MSLQFADYKQGDFEVSAQMRGAQLTLFLKGSVDAAQASGLGSQLTTMHSEAVRLKASEVRIDLTALSFMCSSGFKRLITWLTQVQSIDAAARFKVLFVSNPESRWQRASLAALSCFAPELVVVEEAASKSEPS